MNYDELERRVAELPGVGESGRPYLLVLAQRDAVTGAAYNIVPREDGAFEVWEGDGRSSATPVTGADGEPRVFPTEDAVCEWVLQEIVEARRPRPEETGVSEERARESAERQRQRMRDLLGG